MKKLAILFVSLSILTTCYSRKQEPIEQKPIVTPEPITQQAPAPSRCPNNMLHVTGLYCPKTVQNCLEYKDKAGSIVRRCTKFDKSQCTSDRAKVEFCIDKYEYSMDGSLPVVGVDWNEAEFQCEMLEKRLCTDTEWTFACEGEEQLPYPYGYKRDSNACNIDSKTLVVDGKFVDSRAPVTAYPKCVSSFGVQNMTGNVDEWIYNSNGSMTTVPYVSGLKGGWWGPLRNRCRPMTAGHSPGYKQGQIGFRCCKDV